MKRGEPMKRKTPLRAKRPTTRGHRPADHGWRKVRAEVAARTFCEANTPACPPGRHRGAHAHHVRLRSQGGPDEAWNLLWVCHLAHDFIHGHPKFSYEQGWMARTESADG